MKTKLLKFALIGASGFVAPRHLRAIKEIGGQLVAAVDLFDSAGVLDAYFPEAAFFTEFERFDRYLDKIRRQDGPLDYISICSPNYLHDAHVRFGLRNYANVICEKPLVINPWNLDALEDFEKEYQRSVYTILQLRHHPAVRSLKTKVEQGAFGKKPELRLTYITSRGKWYYASWKGDENKSGGIATNIGIHFFDMLLWIFGPVVNNSVFQRSHDRASGQLELENGKINWFLSINEATLPPGTDKKTFRSLLINGEEFEFSDGFADLHSASYQAIEDGNGYGISDARPAVELAYDIRTCPLVSIPTDAHPLCLLLQIPHPFQK
jgi:UDP-N-acetyl-2-amino-2-deoxyglucuronate dehydrogenase